MAKSTFKKLDRSDRTREVEPQPTVETAPSIEESPNVEEKPTTSTLKDWVPQVIGLSDSEFNPIFEDLRLEMRRRRKDRESKRPATGARVRIVGGNPKLIGKEGTALIVRRTRCFVSVDGVNSPAYVLLSDIEAIVQ